MTHRQGIRFTCVLLATVAVNTAAQTSSAGPESAVPCQAAPEQKARVERYEVGFPASRIRGGGARVVVRQPLTKVLAVVNDFERYPGFIRRIEAVRVVEDRDGHRDISLTVPILNGRSRLSSVLRFGSPRRTGNEQVLASSYVRGNVERMEIVYRLEPVGTDQTRLSVEMLVDPKLPLPGSLVTKEVTGAAAHFVNNLRKEAERRP
ncbi:MAG: SRPBCC family protein [Polyangiaceae bacterium]|nr:SRPBCC family protein [Polyangiaceae bacterium]